MRKILAFVFLCVFQQANAQVLVSDTSYLTFNSGRFFDVRVITFDDGSSETFSRFVCDTATAYRYFLSETNVAAASLATRVREANRIRQDVNALRAKLLFIASVSPVSILDSFMRDLIAPLRNQTWALTYTEGSDTVRFTTTANGQGRYQIGAAAARQFQIIGPDILCMVNMPVGVSAGNTVVLHRVNESRYENIGRTYVLRRVSRSGPQSRTAEKLPDDAPKIMPIGPAKPRKRQRQ